MAEKKLPKGFDVNDPTYQRLRQRLQNTVNDGLGSINADEFASYLKDIDPTTAGMLMKEFAPKLGNEFFDDAYRIRGNYDRNYISQGLGLWNDANAALSDFASLDRDDDNVLSTTARGLANIPLWASEGFKTGGQGISDIFHSDENDLNDGSFGQQAGETLGVLGAAGKAPGVLKTGYNQAKNIASKIYNNPKALLSPKKLFQGAKNNKTALATGGAIAGAKSFDNPDGEQNIIRNEEGDPVALNPLAPTNTPQPELPKDDLDSLVPQEGAENTPVDLSQVQPVEMSGGFEGPMNAARSMGKLDPRDKSLQGFGEEVAQKNLVAEGNRRLKRDTQKAKADDRVAAIDDHTQRVLAERAALQRRAKLARDLFGAPFDSSVEAKKQRMQEFADTGSAFVDPNDPENKNKAPGQVSRDEFMKRTGLTNPGTAITQNPDGTFNTLEFGNAFENAGGIDTARQQLMPEGLGQGSMSISRAKPATLANIENQVAGDNSFTYADGSQGPAMKDGSIRASSNMQDYGDASFATKEDALAYLNRGNDESSAPAEPMNPEDEGLDWTDYLTGAGLLGTGALLYKTPAGKKLIQRGVNAFGKNKQPTLSNPWTTAANSTRQAGTPQSLGQSSVVRPMQGPAPLAPMQGPPAPQYLSNPYRSTRNMKPEYYGKTPQDLAPIKPMQGPAPLGPSQGPPMPQYLSNPYRSTRNMRPEYRGGTPEAPRPTLDSPTNPMSSTASMRRPVRTPQDVGMDEAISAMDRPSLIKAAGGARNASGKMATDEELRRLAKLKAQGLL